MAEAGGYGAGADGADADAIGAQVFGHAIGHAEKSPFGGAVEAASGERIFAGERADVDNVSAAAGNHSGDYGAAGEEHSFQIGVQYSVPVAFGAFVDGAEAAGAGVVDEEVDGAEMGKGFFDEGGDLGGGGDVGGHGEDVVGFGRRFGRQLGNEAGAGGFERIGIASAYSDARAEFGEAFGDGEADAAAGSGDESDVSGEGGSGSRISGHLRSHFSRYGRNCYWV